MWAIFFNHLALHYDALKLLIETPQMLMRESV
jgi:hypothetical protein